MGFVWNVIKQKLNLPVNIYVGSRRETERKKEREKRIKRGLIKKTISLRAEIFPDLYETISEFTVREVSVSTQVDEDDGVEERKKKRQKKKEKKKMMKKKKEEEKKKEL